MTTVAGVDAYRGGWVGVTLRDGAYAGIVVAGRLADLVRDIGDAAAIGVDIPLGLMAAGTRGTDTAARALLGRRRSTVFEIAPRPCWEQPDHAAASALSRQLMGKGMSIQSWGLRAKLLDANTVYDDGAAPLWEVHPELSFRQMGLGFEDGTKKSWRGQRARLRVLADHGIELPEDLGAAAHVPADDVLDAAAVSWSAARIAAGRAYSVPDPPQVDERGRRIAIWC
ncbi:DUF429 domain-containing protein [Mycolicibacterium fluoranthenivorans]|uniref:DUF429 domain-containing protein n=1 Tax=Mycolicibacterium fluoranthenivorans TaxID=258505 RepID=A0A1G4WEJ5_9MYCO|nr:DUF429 domain-containing protein [Mycolicibacterium fluoranthenivorans]QNJ90305.1 DUF429 domain-containing protein [Mycolicibacterium fluoranthenivorans]SCX20712.1 Predicted nuclease (RNAse H fold) [Mycolicibacterium fluoranthenivorans]